MLTQFPSNQNNPLKTNTNTNTSAPIATIHKTTSTDLGDSFKKVGVDLLQQQIPGVIHRVLHSLVDAIFSGNNPTPFVGRSSYGSFAGGGYQGSRMAQVPSMYGSRTDSIFMRQNPVSSGTGELLSTKKAFDTFILADKETAIEIFQALIMDADQAGYLTVSQVYGRLGLPCSFMGAKYYWTAEHLSGAEIVELPTGQCRVKMPKALIIN